MSGDNQSSGRDQLLYFEQAAQILVGQIRVALERRLGPEEVSLVLQETSDLLAEHLKQINGSAVSQSVQDRIDALIIDLRMW